MVSESDSEQRPPKPQDPILVTVQEGYSLWADSYDDGNALIELEEREVEGLLQDVSGRRALDVGAGTGRYALKLARRGAHVTAMDRNQPMLDVARRSAESERLGVEFVTGSLGETLPIGSSEYEFVVCALTLCHVPDLSGAVREFHRVLKPGGTLLITDFHPDSVGADVRTNFGREGVSYQLPNEPHTRETYLNATTDAGFELVIARDLLTREATRERFSAGYWQKYRDINFCLIVLARKSGTR